MILNFNLFIAIIRWTVFENCKKKKFLDFKSVCIIDKLTISLTDDNDWILSPYNETVQNYELNKETK